MTEIIITKSANKNKKYDARIDGKKTISFGSAGMSDYRIHKDDERKQRYLDRHKKNENWSDPKTAGFMSRWLLWNKPTLTESIKDTNNRFKDINIKYKN
jgi:hypothetical protein